MHLSGVASQRRAYSLTTVVLGICYCQNIKVEGGQSLRILSRYRQGVPLKICFLKIFTFCYLFQNSRIEKQMIKDKKTIIRYLLIAIAIISASAFGYSFAQYYNTLQTSWSLPTMIVSALVVLLAPIWQSFVVNAPKLSVEIASIDRKLSDKATINIRDIPELAILNYVLDQKPASSVDSVAESRESTFEFRVDQLEAMITLAEQKLIDLPKLIDFRRKEIKNINENYRDKLKKYDADMLSIPLEVHIQYDEDDSNNTLDEIIRGYEDKLKKLEEKYSDIAENFQPAKNTLYQIQRDLLESRSYFVVLASLINSGRYSTAIRAPALLRIYIGINQHVDLELELNEFQKQSEVSASGTRNVVFSSLEIRSLPEDNRMLVNRYWNKNNISQLFLEDIYSKKYISNYVVFADGLYRKHIYNKLAQVADNINRRGNPFKDIK